ncbi:MAG: glycosyltransferase family 4 protein [Candidatus Helarchaeota archaeon]
MNFRLSILTGIFPPDIGGPATYCYRLKNSLEDLGFQVSIITYKDTYLKIEDKKNIKRIDRKFPLPLKLILTILNSLKIIPKTDLIYAQDPILTAIPAVLLSKIFKKKLIFKIVGDQAWETSRRYNWTSDDINKFQITQYSSKIQLLKQIQRFLCKFPSKIIVPSVYLKKLINSWGIDNKKIIVIKNSINFKESIKKKVNANFKTNFEDVYLLSVGRLENWKRFDIVIKTLSKLQNKFKLFIVGEGTDLKKLQSLTKQLGIQDRVYFLGKLDHQDLLNLYGEIDIVILLSEYEGYSHVLIEALLNKKYIIATKIGGNPEIIQDQKNGILIKNDVNELRKAILKITNGEIKLKPEFSKKWTWNDLLNQTLKIFLK